MKGKVVLSGVSISVLINFLVTLTVTSAQTGPVETCVDQLANCAGYIALNKGFCTRPRNSAIAAQCKRTCKACTTMPPPTSAPTTLSTTTTRPVTMCKNKLPNSNCSIYDPLTCPEFVGFYSVRCAQFCGYCEVEDITSGFHGKCFYKEKSYKVGETWYDGCDYECVCKDGKTGEFECTNRCPAYYNVPPECTFVKKEGECCLQPVCNFVGILDVKMHVSKGQDKDGNAVCIHQGKEYEQGALVQDDCTARCQCVDASKGEVKCHNTCPRYDASTLPPNCFLHQEPGTCCQRPKCRFDPLKGGIVGSGTTSGRGIERKEYNPDDIKNCKDLDPKCLLYGKSTCTGKLTAYMTDKCPVYCGVCDKKFGRPALKEEDKCYHQGFDYNTGEVWRIDCVHECVCDDQLYGYYHCYSRCPQYKTIPPGCRLTQKTGECSCQELVCDSNKVPNITFSTTNIVNIGGGDHITEEDDDGNKVPVLPPVSDDGTVPAAWKKAPGINGCLHNGRLLYKGEISSSVNCSDVCQCVDAERGELMCFDRCFEYDGVENCTMVPNPDDACCMMPDCSKSGGTSTPKKKTKLPKTVIEKVARPDSEDLVVQTNLTVKTTPKPAVSSTPGVLPESANPPPTLAPGQVISSKDSDCAYKRKVYKSGERWVVGCDFNCLCVNGASICLPRCKRFTCPQGRVCTSYQDKNFPCCSLLDIEDLPTTVPPTPETGTGDIPPGWLLLLKGVTGVPDDLNKIWTDTGSNRTRDNTTQILIANQPGHFKSVYAERFDKCGFEKIRVSMYSRGVEKSWIVFNASGTDKNGWFDEDRIVSSSWSPQPLHVKYVNSNSNRQFEVYDTQTSACTNTGWMFVSTKKGGCDYQTKANEFHFSPLSSSVSYDQMELADVFAITAQGGVCDDKDPLPLTCSYKKQVYLVGDKWQDGCTEKCNCSQVDFNTTEVVCKPLCETYTNLQPGCKVVKKADECCGSLVGETCYGGGKCWDKFSNVTRAVGDVWRVGCDYECDCSMQTAVGFVTQCRAICPTWNIDGIPDCVTPTPRPGKCCSLPVCPGIVFELPDKYKKDF